MEEPKEDFEIIVYSTEDNQTEHYFYGFLVHIPGASRMFRRIFDAETQSEGATSHYVMIPSQSFEAFVASRAMMGVAIVNGEVELYFNAGNLPPIKFRAEYDEALNQRIDENADGYYGLPDDAATVPPVSASSEAIVEM